MQNVQLTPHNTKAKRHKPMRPQRPTRTAVPPTFEERKVWLAAPCTITLTETATFFLLEKADSQIAIDSEQARRVQERNDQYAALVKGKEPSRYAERSAQHRGRPALPSPGAPEWMFDPNNPPFFGWAVHPDGLLSGAKNLEQKISLFALSALYPIQSATICGGGREPLPHPRQAFPHNLAPPSFATLNPVWKGFWCRRMVP